LDITLPTVPLGSKLQESGTLMVGKTKKVIKSGDRKKENIRRKKVMSIT